MRILADAPDADRFPRNLVVQKQTVDRNTRLKAVLAHAKKSRIEEVGARGSRGVVRSFPSFLGIDRSQEAK